MALVQSVPGDLVSQGAGSDSLMQSAVRKAALRFVPLLTIAYLFNYLDRTSLGFAALTMNQQLGLTASQFGFAAGILFLGYSLFEVPSNLLLYRIGARRWLARIMITWGLVSAATAFVVGPNSFMGCVWRWVSRRPDSSPASPSFSPPGSRSNSAPGCWPGS